MRRLSIALAGVAVLLVLLVLLLWLGRDRGTSPASAPGAASAADPQAGVEEPSVALADPAMDMRAAASSVEPAARTIDTSRAAVRSRCRVLGRVLDERGTPIAGASVSLYAVGGAWTASSPSPEPGELRTQTDGAGRFAIEAPVPKADWVSLTITPDPHHALIDRHFGPAGGRNLPRLVEGDNDVGDIQLALSGAATGRAVDDAGAPVPHPRVAIQGFDGRFAHATGDELGRFVIGHAPQGGRTFSVSADGWLTRENLPVEIEGGVTKQVPDVVLARAASISGIVVDSAGAPLAKATVRGLPVRGGTRARASSAPDGTFVLYLQAVGAHTLEVRGPKELGVWTGAPGETFEAGRTDVRAVLERLPRMLFRVVDARTRQPVEHYGIGLDEQPSPGSRRNAREIPRADHPGGIAEMPLPRGPMRVTVDAAGYAPLQADVEPAAEQTLALWPASSIRGRVTKGGAPVAKARLFVQRESLGTKDEPVHFPGTRGTNIHVDVGDHAGRPRSLEGSADGTFVVSELCAGTFALQVDAPGSARTLLRGLKVPPEGVLDLGDVELAGGAVVRGVVVTGPSESPTDIVIRLDPGLGGRTGRAEADGTFEFDGLPAGSHAITWWRENMQPMNTAEDERLEAFELVAGETREFGFDATASAPARVVVRVARRGEPVARCRVAALVRGKTPDRIDHRNLGVTDEKGVCEGLVEGGTRFDVVAMGDGGRALGTGGRDLRAEPGGRIEDSIELSTGSLKLALDASIAVPERGRVTVSLRPSDGGEVQHVRARTESMLRGLQEDVVWSGPEIRFAEIASGEFEATVNVYRLDPDPDRPGSWKNTLMRDPLKVRVMIEEGREATIRVP